MGLLFDASLPSGQQFYLISKLSALLALACLFLQIIFMLLSRYTKFVGTDNWCESSHRWLGVSTFLLIVTHSVSFVSAASLRGGTFAFSLLVPNFHSGLYNAAVSLGLIAFYLSIILIIMGVLSRQSHRKFSRFHRWIVWPLLMCVLVHSVAIGSESKTLPMILFYVASLAVIVWLLMKKNNSPVDNF